MTDEISPQNSSPPIAGGSDARISATPPRLLTLILLTALAVLPVNMIAPSLPHIAVALNAGYALTSLAVAVYAIATALTELIAGFLSDRFGRRPVVLIAVILFIIASIGCALAGNIGVFLLCRAAQASIAACFSIALVIIKETSVEHQAASKFGYLATGWAIAPLCAPSLGGLLDQLFGWQASFVVLALLGVAALGLALHDLRETAARAAGTPGNHRRAYRHLLGSARFLAYSLCMACSMGTLYIFLGGAPLAAGKALGVSGTQLGLYMGLIPAGFILGSFLAGRYAARLSRHLILIGGRLLTCFGLTAGLILSLSGAAHPLVFFVPCMFIGIGNGLSMPAANAGALSVRAEFAGTAAGLAAALTIGGGAVIVSLAGPFLTVTGTAVGLFALLLLPASFALLAAFCATLTDRRGAGPAC